MRKIKNMSMYENKRFPGMAREMKELHDTRVRLLETEDALKYKEQEVDNLKETLRDIKDTIIRII